MKSSQEITYYFILSLLAACVVILCLVLILFCRKKPVESEESLPAARISAQGYPSTDIDAATDGFNHRRIIGTGRLGSRPERLEDLNTCMEGWHRILFMDALDDKLCARASDYGLSSLVANEKRGLVGYVDDEFWSNGGGEACKESDVYGFGVVLLELLTGRRTEEGLLVRWALPLIKEMRLSELLDLRLEVATILNNLEIELCA
ncbi:hypothetical protein POTOM_016887 [Populus tomentosa]|uniref:Uncharacterized protein n=1 Tax=Populus tomentosa TaxID=118781 RepID=A0A8X8A9R8_POPTO|nr:hypothetical protein POTOM_016887 [Populus tomentosa]